ncbi:RHS repeat-associated core domain-containing protein [Vibrio harveyi]|uniref:RHS repeat-associated core domain-containing protein n=1 Tax=Vibrio harveyi TaxID=669 RepID=UPI00373593BC
MNSYRISALGLAISVGLVGCGSETQTLDTRLVSPALTEMDLSTPPTHQQLSEAGQLGGVLSPTYPVEDKVDPNSFHLMDLISNDDEEERLAFGQAIQNWNKHQYASASSEFDVFRKQYPNSAWASEATLHMACNARFTGQYSTASQLFNEVIQANQDSDYSGAQQMVAKAKSRLAVLRLMENNPEEAKNLFADVATQAPDWRLRTYASIWLRKLSLLEQDAGGLLDCGTRALAYLLNRDGHFNESEKVLAYVPANEAEGFNIEELTQLAVQYGYHALAVKATVAELAELTEPAILQISRASTGGKGHYWVLERVEAGQFHIVDPQMNRRFQFSAEQLEKEWQGNVILLSQISTPQVGTLLSLEDAKSTHGGCCGIQRPPSEGGEPGSEPDDNAPNKEGSNADKSCRGRGAPTWSVNMVNLNLYMTDTPLWYDNTVGPGVEIKLSYNTQSVLAQNEPFGHRWMFNYSSYLVVDPGGAVTIFETDGSESVFVQNSKGEYQSDRYSSTSLTHDEHGKWSLTYADGSQRIYGVPEGTKALQNFLLAEVDNAGHQVSFGYDENAKMTHVTDALGRVTHLHYNSLGLIERVDDPFGRYALFEYDEARNLVALTDMEGYRAALTYGEDHLVTSLTDAKGTTQFNIEPADGIKNNFNAYNAPGTAMWENYRITVTLPTGGKEEYYFDGYHKKSWYVDADHYQEYGSSKNNSHSKTPKTVYEFVVPNGRSGEISKITYPDGASVAYKYYSNNKLKSVTDPFGQKVEYSWTKTGQLSRKVDSLGHSTQLTYADNGLDMVRISSPFGDERFTYDDEHRVIQYTDVDGLSTGYGYDSNGNLISTTDANGVTTALDRDDKGRVTSIRVGSEIVSRYEYDEIGRVISNKDASDYETHFQYNKINTLIQIRDAANRTIQRQFGSCPRVLEKETLPGGRDYQYRYDAQKQLTEVINPAKGRIKIGRSKSGQITSLTDQHQNQTSFEYTTSGALSKKIYPDGSVLKYKYNKGRIKQVTNARGITKTFHFNKKQQLYKIDYSDETPSVEYSYNELGLLSEVKDAIGFTRYQYERNGRLSEIDGPRDSDTIRLQYNRLDLLSELYLGETLNTAYQYDELGRVVEINALGQRFTYHYDHSPLAFSTSVILPNGITRKMTLDELGDLSAITYKSKDTTLVDYQYRFDEAGQLAEQTGTPAWILPKQAASARYNELNQITEWNGETNAFVYDKDGNPTKGVLADGVPFEAKYDAENRLTTLNFTRDNVQYREQFAYAHDHMLAQYQLYKDKALVEEKQFVRYGLVELQQRNAQGEVVQEYAWDKSAPGGIGGLLVAKTNNDVYTYIYNHLGHVQKVLNSSGQVVESYQYTPYGQVEGGSFSEQPFGYSTKRSDFASGLVYFGYRFYSPYQRRWLNRDPLQEQGGINLYAYVNGDPLGYIDPDGRFVLVSPPPPLPIGLPINQMTGNSPNNGWVDSPEASLMHDYYKNSCGPKLPPSGDECQDYRNEANQASMCAHLRSQWDDRFWPGRHTKAIMDSQRRAKKYNRLADDCERAREVMNCQ